MTETTETTSRDLDDLETAEHVPWFESLEAGLAARLADQSPES